LALRTLDADNLVALLVEHLERDGLAAERRDLVEHGQRLPAQV
jgi:hypothetical protein